MICAYFASARGEAKLPFDAVGMMLRLVRRSFGGLSAVRSRSQSGWKPFGIENVQERVCGRNRRERTRERGEGRQRRLRRGYSQRRLCFRVK
jgi:hypothetical protein